MEHAIYLSHPLSNDTPLYGGAKNIQIDSNSSIKEGDTANSLSLVFSNHSGTHVDVPYHFFEDGKKIMEYPPSFWIFNCPQCLDVPGKDGYLVTFEDVKGRIKEDTDLLLLRTGYEKYRNEDIYWQMNPGLSPGLAKGIRKKFPNIRALGVDVISITSRLHREKGRKAHQEFLGSHFESDPIVLIEDMSLQNFNKDFSQAYVMPLMVKGADGAPCTALGIK